MKRNLTDMQIAGRIDSIPLSGKKADRRKKGERQGSGRAGFFLEVSFQAKSYGGRHS